jgi:uncharacterized protein (TIRG00374 family)
MSPRLRKLAFAIGLALFALFIFRVGPAELLANARRTGLMLFPIVGLWAVVYSLSTASWRLILADEPGCPRFRTMLVATISGWAINYMTPFFSVGGEPLKIAAAASWIGNRRRAAASVMTHRLLFTMAHLISLMVGVGIGVALFPRHPLTLLALGAAGVVVLGFVALVLMIHRQGILERFLNAGHRIPGLRTLARIVEPRREALVEMDRHITTFHHGHPRRFWTALALEFVARSLIMVEYVLILWSVGVSVSYAEAYAIGTITGMVGMALFIIPFEMGTKEGAFYGVFQMMGIDPHLGVYTAIINRVWEAIWIALGLGLIWIQGGAREVATVVEKAQHVVELKPGDTGSPGLE